MNCPQLHTQIARVKKDGGTNEIVKNPTFDYTNKVERFLVKFEGANRADIVSRGSVKKVLD